MTQLQHGNKLIVQKLTLHVIAESNYPNFKYVLLTLETTQILDYVARLSDPSVIRGFLSEILFG